MEEIIGRSQLADEDEIPLRRIGTNPSQNKAVDEKDPKENPSSQINFQHRIPMKKLPVL